MKPFILEAAVENFSTMRQRATGFCRCEFIRTEHIGCANEFAPTHISTAFYRFMTLKNLMGGCAGAGENNICHFLLFPA
jgi:hypothetical protein